MLNESCRGYCDLFNYISHCFSKLKMLEADPVHVGQVLNGLMTAEDVLDVVVNSTFGRTYVMEKGSWVQNTTRLPFDNVLLTAQCKGKGLIICNRNERDGWDKEQRDAYFVLHNQLGFEVICFKPVVIFLSSG